MMRRFAIGDIHGCHKTLKYLVEEKIRPAQGDKLFFVGDYIDRGPDSKAVIDFIFKLQDKGIELKLLRGNHEEMMLQARKGSAEFEQWIMNNGFTTLNNFGIENFEPEGFKSIEKIPQPYIDFFNSLKYYDDSQSDYVFVHAGLNFVAGNPFEDKRAMLWQREENYDENFMQGRTIVHGHTPVPVAKIKKQLSDTENKIINLDAGCVYKSHSELGNLVALNLDKRELIVCPNRD